MAQRYWEVYAKPVRDRLVSLIKARADADGVSVGEILAGLGRGRHSFQASGIYVLPPAYRPLGGTPTQTLESDLLFPVLVRCELFEEDDYLEVLGALCGLVVDAVEASQVFSVTSATGEVSTVELAYIEEVERPQLTDADGEAPSDAAAVVHVACKLARTA
jgi:hypothetical protein